MYIVGTPRKTVTRSRCRIRSAAAGSNRGSRVRVAPATTAALRAQVCPKAWNSGRPPNRTSSGPIRISVSTVVTALVDRLRWVSSAPFGVPVVPEV